MDPNTLLPWLFFAAGILLLLAVVAILLRSWAATRDRMSQQSSELASKLAQIQSGTDEAVRLARDALTTSVSSIQNVTVTAQETRHALDTMTGAVREDREELRQTLVRAMEDNRAVNRAVVIAVQGIADTAKEELNVTRSAAAYMAEVVKALQGVSSELGEAAMALRESNSGRAGRLHELSTGSTHETRALEGPAHDTGLPPAPGFSDGDYSGARSTYAAGSREAGRAEDAQPVRMNSGAGNQGNQGNQGDQRGGRPKLPNDIIEVLQLYAGSFATLINAYQAARPLSDNELDELATTYYTTWISRLRSLRDRNISREVWQRFYMYAIAVQTMNNFGTQLEGPNLELAIRFWERQAQLANVPMHLFLKITEIMRRQAQQTQQPNTGAPTPGEGTASTRDELANAS